MDLIFSDEFSCEQPGLFDPIRDTLLNGDYYMHLADLMSYAAAQARAAALHRDPDAWAREAILNVAASGRFSSDRTIANMPPMCGTRSRVRSPDRGRRADGRAPLTVITQRFKEQKLPSRAGDRGLLQ